MEVVAIERRSEIVGRSWVKVTDLPDAAAYLMTASVNSRPASVDFGALSRNVAG